MVFVGALDTGERWPLSTIFLTFSKRRCFTIFGLFGAAASAAGGKEGGREGGRGGGSIIALLALWVG